MLAALVTIAVLHVAAAAGQPIATSYFVDDSAGPGRTFHGIGGLSGGGATSVLLRDYPEPQRSQILDYLFKPNFGASLQILKVEIGGDAQSTDGSESSHMHDPWTADFNRGYEWYLLQQAKARNPAIYTYGLPWAFPRWVSCSSGLSNCSGNPYTLPEKTASYVVSWVQGAKAVYDVDVDYIGSWNERGYDKTYLETLRGALDAAGFASTKLIAADSSFGGVAKDVNSDPAFAKALWGLGAHYPNMQSGPDAEATGKPLWASEEDSTYNNAVGAACWARVINQNHVRGNMTASINWNLLAAYMKGTQWWRAGLMTAFQPWSGAYGSLAMVWATAHTTQFSTPYTYNYLINGTGAGTGTGLLAAGGSYVTLEDFATGDFSIVIEKMSRDHSPCCRPALAKFSVAAESATFTLRGRPARATTLQLWRTHWSFGAPGDATEEFIQQAPLSVAADGTFTLLIEPDSLYTVTTLTTGHKGGFATPVPPQALFPAQYVNNFTACAPSAEAPYFSDQNGIWECQPADAAGVVAMRQMVPLLPIAWGGDTRPHSLIGSRDLTDTSMVLDARLTATNGSFLLGARLAGTTNSAGLIVALDATGAWNITGTMATVQSGPALYSGALAAPFGVNVWRTLRLDVNGSTAVMWVDGARAFSYDFSASLPVAVTGHSGVGTVQFGHYSEFTNFALYSTQRACSASAPAAGAPIVAVSCASEVGPRAGGQFVFTPSDPASCPYGSPCANSTGTFALASNPSLCITVAPGAAGDDWPLALAPCSPSASREQSFTQNYVMLYSSNIVHADSGRTVCLEAVDIGAAAYAHKGGVAKNCGAFSYQGDEQEIVTINAYSVCLGTC